MWAEQSVVTVLAPADRPQPRRRDTIGLPPRRGTTPIGRDTDLAVLLDAITTDRLLQVYGPPGTGKSTLIRHAAASMADTSTGVVFLSAAGRDVEDVLQDVFETCYEAAGYRPGLVELRRLMAGIELRLFVDDLDVLEQQRVVLLDGVPATTVVYTSTERTVWADGRALALTGLDEAAGLALLAQLMDRPLHADEQAAATELWRASDGLPLLLLRAVAGARRGDNSTVTLPRAAELPGLLPRVLAQLSAPARTAVAVLAVAGGSVVAAELLPWLIGDAADVTTTLTELADLGVAITTGRGYHLAPGADAALPWEWRAGAAYLEWMADRLAHWTRLPGVTPQAVADHVGLITGIIDATVAAGRADLGARLARVTAPLAACSLRLGAWEQILRHGVEAARLAGDRATVAYLTHEDGVHKLITGRRVAAVAAVGAAIAIWHELGDTAHLALAHHIQGLAAPAAQSLAAQSMAGHTAAITAMPPPIPPPPSPIAAGHAWGGATAAHHAALGAKASAVAAKTGLGLSAKLAITVAATVVATGTAVGVTVLATQHRPTAVPPASSEIINTPAPIYVPPDTYTPPTDPTTQTGDPTTEAAAITNVLTQAHTDRQAVINAVNDAMKCGANLANDKQVLQTAQSDRQQSAQRAGQLAIDALPGASAMPRELSTAFSDSATADADFASWITDLQSNCRPSSVTGDPNFQAAGAASTQANQDKQALLSTWNPIAQQYGQPTWAVGDI
ncbi:MAG TPA: hypothetical protein VH352_03670 [Pseudonocardiaceae bacterium]|nr:hypothetical protein [Pseudonocardiaceae bacterium]